MPFHRMNRLLSHLATAAADASQLRDLQAAAPKKPLRCNDLPRGSYAAYDQLMSLGPATLCADFLKGIRDWKLQGLLRQASRGKVIICPSNNAMRERFIFQGLYKSPDKIPIHAKQSFRDFVRKHVAVPRSTILLKHGCGNVYVAFKWGNQERMKIIPAGKGVRGAATAQEFQFSILGQGYNAYIGFPISFGMAAFDPGFTLTPIFDLTPDDVRTLSNTGGGCQSQFSTSQFFSAEDTKLAAAGGVSVNIKALSFTFSGSVSLDYLTKSSTTSQTITTTSTAKVYLGGYGMVGSPASMKLNQAFIDTLLPLMQAASEDRYDGNLLASLVDNFGTHYIKTVWWGGLASSIQQMTASAKAEMDSLQVKGNLGFTFGKLTTVEVSGNVTFSSENSQKEREYSETFSQILIPASVPLPVTQTKFVGEMNTSAPAPTYIDCVQWTQALRDASLDTNQGFKAPVVYTLAPLDAIFSMPSLFPKDWASVLPAMAKQVDSYINLCGYTAQNITAWSDQKKCADPPAAESTCVLGTYKTKSGGCNTCYGTGQSIGPNCNFTTTIACSAYSCFCKPAYALDPVANQTCLPLAPNPPAPPTPSLSQLSGAKKKK
ncbi:hypothetical protein ABPG77_006080 [Micractinium sp. CCAP 211/92]